MTAPAAATGYRSEAYARSLHHLGHVRPLSGAGGWLLVSGVPGVLAHDGRAPYPLFLCADWEALASDLASLEGLVSVTMVVDALAPLSRQQLDEVFDVVRPFKTHHVVDVSNGALTPSRHHARKLRAVGHDVEVKVLDDPTMAADDWVRLYRDLVHRHDVTGFADLPEHSLRDQLAVPGCIAVRATCEDRCVSMALWYRHDDAAHFHLGASDHEGYATGAAYAVMAASLEHLASTPVQVVDLGGVAGAVDDPANGLARFKGGWASDTATAHLCGAILDPDTFYALRTKHAPQGTTYFPPYRAVGR